MSERITLAQLAAISMLTERTLRSYLKRGLLAGEKTPGGWRFTAEQTAAFLALPQVRSASNARRNAVAEDFIQRRMGQIRYRWEARHKALKIGDNGRNLSLLQHHF